MSEAQQISAGAFPANWHIARDYDPNDHLMNLKGRDYLNVQNRLLWFIRDQRGFISSGLARMPYVIQTDLVALDREAGFAHFKTTVRDVLGNEATMYGSETAKDFPDYAEKASTKSLGRALLALGYGTAFASEMDEGERVVDSPVERRRVQQTHTQRALVEQAQQPAARKPPEPLPTASKATTAVGHFDPMRDIECRREAAMAGYRSQAEYQTFVDEATGGDLAGATKGALLDYARARQKVKAGQAAR